MPLDFPNIVPENNLRLPDALTVKHGPAPLLSRFVLRGDQAVRQWGIRLRIRTDFDELAYANKTAVATGTWFPLVNMFNPDIADLRPENAYWISGESESGEIVLTGAFRIFNWSETTLADEAGTCFCDKEGKPHPCIVTAPAAGEISGVVCWGGSLWIRPNHRRRHLSALVGRLGRAFATARWPVDWMMCMVVPALAEKGVVVSYGYKHLSRGVHFPGSPLGDLELIVAYLSANEAYADFAEFLSDQLRDPDYFGNSESIERRLESIVTRISSEPVVHGNISLS